MKRKKERQPDPRPKLEEAVIATSAYFGGMSIADACALGKRFSDEALGRELSMPEILTWLDRNRV